MGPQTCSVLCERPPVIWPQSLHPCLAAPWYTPLIQVIYRPCWQHCMGLCSSIPWKRCSETSHTHILLQQQNKPWDFYFPETQLKLSTGREAGQRAQLSHSEKADAFASSRDTWYSSPLHLSPREDVDTSPRFRGGCPKCGIQSVS